MALISFKMSGLKEITNDMALVRNAFDKERKKFMESEGRKLRYRVIKKAEVTVKRKSGNYLAGIRKGGYYVHDATGADSIRVFVGRPAYHGHLIEYGHKMLDKNKKPTKRDYVQGYHVLQEASDEFERKYEKDTEKFFNKITKPLDR